MVQPHMSDRLTATHTPRRKQYIISPIRSVFLPTGSCTAVSGYVISFSESVGALLECEKYTQKGTHLLFRRWLWGLGMDLWF